MFAPRYIDGLEAFTVQMPSTYSKILLNIQPFTAGEGTAKYLLSPQVYVPPKQAKETQGDHWANVKISPTSTVSDNDTLQFIRAAFSRAGLNAVNLKIMEDKKLGTRTNIIRVGFNASERFDPRNLKPTLARLQAPDNTTWYTQFSKTAADQFHIHDRCLGLTSDRAPLHVRCACSTLDSSAGPSTSLASRQAALQGYQARALKRAREEPDPFA